ncbi:MAG: hypothetical protein AAGE96_05360 [Cyanobacteria bacterium P01_G01_bin.19]
MQWYQTRDKIANATHRGIPLQPNKKVYLTEVQVEQINKKGEKVVECDAPTEESECAYLAEWNLYLKANQDSEAKNAETTSRKEKRSLKANRDK